MSDLISQFCAMVRHRSDENKSAMWLISRQDNILLSPAFSLLRQELDSIIRTIFLLSKDDVEREKYVKDILNGERWKMQTNSGKERLVLDKDMIELAQTLQNWTESVYKFGCAFIHLSEFHNYFVSDPISKLSSDERQAIVHQLSHYHGYGREQSLTIELIKPYLPRVFDKINVNLAYYIKELEAGEKLTD